jgi:hypothetical protein
MSDRGHARLLCQLVSTSECRLLGVMFATRSSNDCFRLFDHDRDELPALNRDRLPAKAGVSTPEAFRILAGGKRRRRAATGFRSPPAAHPGWGAGSPSATPAGVRGWLRLGPGGGAPLALATG